jgi:hypothetical protein
MQARWNHLVNWLFLVAVAFAAHPNAALPMHLHGQASFQAKKINPGLVAKANAGDVASQRALGLA